MNDNELNLKKVLEQINEATKHLKASYTRCQNSGLKEPHSEEDLIDFEALTSRFARVTDMLVHKLYRSIDSVELIEGGTLIDVINRAEKRGIIDSANEIRLMKDLRNDIAHEYAADKLLLIHDEVFGHAPKLLSYIKLAVKYSEKYIKL